MNNKVLWSQLLVNVRSMRGILAVCNVSGLYLAPVILEYHRFTNAFVQITRLNSLEQVSRMLQLRLLRLPDDTKEIIMNVLQIFLRICYDIFEVIDRVGSDERLRDHIIQALACLVQINLPEKFKPPLIYNIDLVVDLFIICYLTIDYAGVCEDPIVIDLGLIDLGVNQVSIQIVELVEVERVTLVCNYVEDEQFLGLKFLKSFSVSFNKLLNQLNVFLCNTYLIHLITKLLIGVLN